jgi:hypothetical protein
MNRFWRVRDRVWQSIDVNSLLSSKHPVRDAELQILENCKSAEHQLLTLLGWLNPARSAMHVAEMNHLWFWGTMLSWLRVRGVAADDAIVAISDGWARVNDHTGWKEPAKDPMVLLATVWHETKLAAERLYKEPAHRRHLPLWEADGMARGELTETAHAAAEMVAYCAEKMDATAKETWEAMLSSIRPSSCNVNQQSLADELQCTRSKMRTRKSKTAKAARGIVKDLENHEREIECKARRCRGHQDSPLTTTTSR